MDNVQSQNELSIQAKTSGLAIASLILGICGFLTCGLTGIVGLILGIVGLCAIKKSSDHLKGQGLAIAGIAVSSVSLVMLFTALLMALLTPELSRTKHQAKAVLSMAKVRQLCLAVSMYCDENNGHFPPSDNWPEALKSYLGDSEDILTSPFDPDAGRAWAMNPNLKTVNIKRANNIVLFFECKFGSPPAGGPELLPEKPRGPSGYVFAFADFSVRCVPPENIDELIWKP